MNVAVLAGIMINVVLPVFLIAGLGYFARRKLRIDPQPLGRVALYLLLPALLFESLLTTKINVDEIGRIGIFAVAMTLIFVAIGQVGGRILGATRPQTAGLTLAISFTNAANYGLPVNLFAFGQDGFDRAVVFVVFSSVLTYSVGVLVAARGRLPWVAALGAAARMPVLWAAGAAVAIRLSGLELPVPIQRATNLLGSAAVPIVLLLLGLQIGGIRLRSIGRRTLGAVAAKLVLSPFIALALVALLAPDPMTAKVLVLQAAMPTAVNATLIAAEFNAEPEMVASAALISTAVSVLTLTCWIAYLVSA